MNIYKIQKSKETRNSQSNFSQFMHGEIPESSSSFIGTPNVDVSQLSSSFSGVSKSVNLVNRFDSKLLLNISFIFNSADQGSYGVYVPALDRAEKEKALRKELEQKGYEIKQEGETLVALDPKGEKSKDDVQRDIDTLWSKLESLGGSVFGVNMSRDIAVANDNAKTIRSNYPPEIIQILEKAMSSVTGSSSVEDFCAIIEVGSTMVHEAVHAGGVESESGPEGIEDSFIHGPNGVVTRVNNIFMSNLKSSNVSSEVLQQIQPLQMKRNARSLQWYKIAQGLNYMPNNSVSDSKGQRPSTGSFGTGQKAGLPDWAMMNRNPTSDNIESKLSRQYMAPLPEGLSQENDSIELQLRKLTESDYKPNPKLIHEELLQRDYTNPSIPYITVEEQLELTRPTPLMKPINQKASISKIATLFGWMNNLSISDGNTIPGLSDRVMPWEPGCQDFIFDERETRKLSRYNPTYYDYAGGVYNAVIEPRFQPQLWSDMMKDITNTHPAKRFASETSEKDDLMFAIQIIKSAKNSILKGQIKATRFLASEDVSKFISKLLSNDKIKIDMFSTDAKGGEETFAVWAYSSDIDSSDIENIERSISNGNSVDTYDLIKELVMSKTNYASEVVKTAEELCREYDLKNINIVGEYARSKFMGEDNPNVSELTFNCCSVQNGVKFGELLADKLGVSKAKYYKDIKMFSFNYNGVKVDFYCGFAPKEIIQLMKENDLNTDNALLIDVCNRDFTINMGVYNLITKTVDFPLKSFVPKIGEIDTLFDPNTLIRLNPLIIMRAIFLRLKYGWKISEKLEKAMISNCLHLLKTCNGENLVRLRDYIKGWGPEKSKELFAEYGLEKLEEL